MTVEDEYFQTTVAKDFFHTFAGEKIGEGYSRKVFECLIDKTVVVKVETGSQSFQNVLEWEMWDQVRHVKGIARWFAPCVSISPCGIVLIQKRAENVHAKDLPDRVPDVFTDLKIENWGRIGRRIVCRDYGFNRAISNGIRTRTRKADWWS